MKVTLRQLEVFDAVATLGSLSSAAERLGMSQSAASSAVNDLQIILGRQLFGHAKGKALQITDEGRRVQSTAREVLGSVRDMEMAKDAAMRGRIVIGATTMIAERLLPPICAAFRERYPDVEIKIETAPSLDLFDRLSRRELETVLIENFPEVEGIELTTWRPDELWLVASPGHPLTERRNLTITDLAGARWCLREARSTTASRLRWLLHEKLGQLPIALEATSNEVVRQAAINGTGIACLSRYLVDDDIAAGRLVRLNVADFRFTRILSLARPRDLWRGQLAKAFDQSLLADVERPFAISERGVLSLVNGCL